MNSTKQNEGKLPENMTIAEMAAWLRVSDSLLYLAAATGELAALRIGRRVIVPRAEAVRFSRARMTRQ